MKNNSRGRLAWMLVVAWSGCLFVFPAGKSPGKLQATVVINELMYHPPDDRDDLQYVELFNTAPNTLDLSGWSFVQGIAYSFPPGTQLPSQDYLVVCRDLAAFQAHYRSGIRALGNFTGKLSHKGEKVELANAQGQSVDAISYADSGGWVVGPDGYGSSLERICPSEGGSLPEHWGASNLPQYKTTVGTPGARNHRYQVGLPPRIRFVSLEPKWPQPGQSVSLTVSVRDPDDLVTVQAGVQWASAGQVTPERFMPMRRLERDESEVLYQAVIEDMPENRILRLRVHAQDEQGRQRYFPAEQEPCPTLSIASLSFRNEGLIPFAFLINIDAPEPSLPKYRVIPPGSRPEPARGSSAFIYLPPGGNPPQLFDHIRIGRRSAGFKVRLRKHDPLLGMKTLNLLFESKPRQVLSEPLSYELYRRAGVPAPYTDHVRLWIDGNLVGYHLLVEQINENFLRRHQRDDGGDLFKLLWYGRNLVDMHEKKTNQPTGHRDLQQLVRQLHHLRGPAQWKFINQHFNVPEFASYFAVNMCLSNWDGFFNNYFTYHDLGGTGKWEIYPWDEDKTWGDYDGAGPPYDWYDMPLTYGMDGDQPPRRWFFFSNRGPHGGPNWWRNPGIFSGPMLANAQFRQIFLRRLKEICETEFTETAFLPLIDDLQRRLAPEIAIWAELRGVPAESAMRVFVSDLDSFRAQLRHRRNYILENL